MYEYNFFTVEQFDNISVLTWTESAARRASHNGERRVELRAFVLTAKPSCVVVSFTRLTQCPSALIGALIGLNRQLIERGSRLTLCEMNPALREQFNRHHLEQVFEIHGSLSDAMADCEESTAGGQHGQEESEVRNSARVRCT